MEVGQQFCLKWNNYHSTVNSIFHKLWQSGTFVDVTLIVENQKIECHKIVLSACSTYFEKLLTEHSSHPHPLIVLHDVPFSAVESLVIFMYKGEINVGRDQLDALLKTADTLKVKGLADSPAMTDFTRMRLLQSNLAQQFYPAHYLQESLLVPLANSTNTVNIPTRHSNSPTYEHPSNFQAIINSSMKRSRTPGSLVLPKKRARHEFSSSSLPPSPPSSRGDPLSQELKVQLHQETEEFNSEIKIEAEEETDNELQIDESAGQSPEESAVESDTMSSRNTPVADFDSQEQREREETAQSLAALSQATINFLPQTTLPPTPQLMLAPKPNVKVKEEKTGGHGGKNAEKTYTMQDLEEGIEQVIAGILTPAKAIAKYKVPRRTFFRRLSGVRKLRGIPSSKENASENYLRNSNTSNVQGNGSHSLIGTGLVQENILNQNKIAGKLTNSNTDGSKKDINSQPFISAQGVFSMMDVANNYEYYLRCLKFNQAANLDKHIKKEATVDGNSNISTTENSDQALSLVTQNGS